MFVRFASKVVLGETRETFTALLPILLIYSTSLFSKLDVWLFCLKGFAWQDLRDLRGLPVLKSTFKY